MDEEELEAYKDLMSRRKILAIPREMVLTSILKLGKCVKCIVHKELPEGYLVKGVENDYKTNCFIFLIVHPDFNVISDGCEAPYIYADLLIKRVYDIEDDNEELGV